MTEVLTREQFYLLNDMYNDSKGRSPIFSDNYLNSVREKSEVMKQLVDMGYIDDAFGLITSDGVYALEPYRVKGAVILAAGSSSRCIPLSLEIPKGLFEVKGERLIERQVKQLQEAGIYNITIVLGYKKSQFYYLQDKYGVRLIDNNDFLVKNNIYSIYLAKDFLDDVYICSCDDYFLENPFNQFEYQSFYAGIKVDKQTDEMYVYTDEDNKIVKMQHFLSKGNILLGHSFWKKDFASSFITLVNNDKSIFNKESIFWEWLIKDNLDDMPSFFYKNYATKAIVEFDYFADLRRFDSGYIKNTHSKIVQNIISVFKCQESDIIDFRNISEGLTNTSIIFKINNVDYIYRHPGEGTELIVNRENEKSSLEIAKQWGVDPTYVYMNIGEGWKISRFIDEFREPDYKSFEDSKKIIQVLKTLHGLPIKTNYGLRPWEDAINIENTLINNKKIDFRKYQVLKEKISRLHKHTTDDGVKKCFCHGDTYCHNWMIKPDGNTILIDWEYAGFADPGIDVGYYIVDAMYDFKEAEQFINEYLSCENTPERRIHFLAYTAIIAYYWFVWALYRESCGAVVGESTMNWHNMADKYADYTLGLIEKN